MQTKPSLRSSTNSSSSGEEANPSSLMAEDSNSSMGSSGSGGGGGAADGGANQERTTPLAPRPRAWTPVAVTQNLVWQRRQPTLNSVFFGTCPCWLASLGEPKAEMMSVSLA